MNTFVKKYYSAAKVTTRWLMFLLVIMMGTIYAAPPAITINHPADYDSTAGSFMDMSFTVSADNYPLSVEVFGDTTNPPAALIFSSEGISSETTIPFTWSSLRIEDDLSAVGLWHFDENSDTVINDASGSGNTGYFVNGPGWTDQGRFGYGVDFDGTDDYITIPDTDNSLDVDSLTGILTIEAWIYPHSVGGGTYHGFISKRDASIATMVNYALYLDDNTGALALYNGTFSPGAGWYESNIVIPANQWSYVAVSLDASEGMLRFYYNGEAKDSISGAKFGPDHDAELTIGTSRTPSGDRCFDGVIDDVRITKRLVTADEIADNYRLNRDRYHWQVKAVDNLSDTSQSTVMNFDVGLILDPIADQSVAEGDNIIIDLTAANPDGASIELTSPDLPVNADLTDNDDGTGHIDFTPAYDQAGDHDITVYADDVSEAVYRVFTVTVTNTNRPPVVSDISDRAIDEGGSFAAIDLEPYVSDPDLVIDDAIIWTYSGNIELAVDITDDIATITIPDEDWYGEETITFRAIDLGGLYDEDEVVFTVSNINDPPEVDDISDIEVVVCNYFEFGVSASDIDGEIVGLSAGLIPAGELPEGAEFEDYGDGTGLFSWTPESLQDGTYGFRITATDDSAATAFEDVTITVQSDGNPPQVSLTSPVNGATTSDPFISLTADVSDEGPMTVRIYGGLLEENLNLLSIEENCTGTTVNYNWDTPVLRPDPENTGGLWPFDEGEGVSTNDASESGSDGQLLGHWPLWTMNGRFGYCLDLNGGDYNDNYVFIPSNSALDVDSADGAITIEAWIYPRDRDGLDQRRRGLIAKQAFGAGPDSPCNYQVFLDESGNLGFSSNGDGWSGEHISAVNVPLDQWTFIAVTLEASEGIARFYANGVLEDDIENVAFAPPIDCCLTIGVSSRQYECFNGLIDEVRITRRTLSDNEIMADYSHIGGGLHYWQIVAGDCSDNETVSEIRSFTVTDDNSPDIILNSPENGAVAIYPHMILDIEVLDESPVTVHIYGDATPSASDLLYICDNAKSTGIKYDWTAAPLEPEPPYTAGLWNFDETQGDSIVDNSYNGNTGVFVGNPARTTAGRFGYGLEFDGVNDYVTIPDTDNSLDVEPVSGAATFEAWIYPEAMGEGTYRAFISKRDPNQPTTVNYAVYLDEAEGAITFYNGNYEIGNGYYVSGIIPPLNEWSYIAVTLDAAEGVLRFYHNGELKDEFPGASYGPVHDKQLTIGTSLTPNGNRMFDGIIDDVRVTKRTLTPEEIAANYRLSGDTYYWRVDACDGMDNTCNSEIRYFITNLFVCGDANGDELINIGDAVFLIAFVFNSGPAPDPLEAGDANGDGNTNVGDAVYLINYVFLDGPPPICP